MPLPLNHSTKRLSMGASTLAPMEVSAAYAVPRLLNMETSGGKPMPIRAPAAVRPDNNARREILVLFVISCDIRSHSLGREFAGFDQRDDQFFEAELRVTEIVRNRQDGR